MQRPFPPHDRATPRSGATIRTSAGLGVRVLMLTVLLILHATPAAAEGAQRTTAAGVIYDALIERPLSLAETILGVGITAVAYPLSFGSGRSNVVVQRCISAPARYTFTRALGDFRNRPSNDCSPIGFGWGLVRMSFGIIERPLGFLFGRSPLSHEAPQRDQEFEVDLEPTTPRWPANDDQGIAI